MNEDWEIYRTLSMSTIHIKQQTDELLDSDDYIEGHLIYHRDNGNLIWVNGDRSTGPGFKESAPELHDLLLLAQEMKCESAAGPIYDSIPIWKWD